MISFFAAYNGTFRDFSAFWAPELVAAVRLRRYGSLLWSREAGLDGAVIFSDMERLPRWQMALARNFSRKLAALSRPPRVLNDPAHYAGRFELLELFHRRGINDFRARRLGRIGELKFPVFLRRDLDHRGPLTGLLHSPAEVGQAIRKLSFRDRVVRRHHLMAVEYVDCRDADGLFRKYSVMNVGGTLIPRHVLLSREWVTKKPDEVSAETVGEEAAFIEDFPHRAQIAEVFKLAHVEYGRVDYGVKNGRLQIWEINTNPTIVPRPPTIHPLRRPLQKASAAAIARALSALAANR